MMEDRTRTGRTLTACLTLAVLAVTAASCGTARHKTGKDTRQRDSVRVEYRERVIRERDTVVLEIPAQTAERETRDSTSFLENDFATSEASVTAGILSHNLKTKPKEVEVEVEKEVVYRDSLVYRDRIVRDKVTVEVEVPRELTWWQKTQIYGFWALLFVALIPFLKKLFERILAQIAKK